MIPELKIRMARPEDDAAIGELLVNSFVATYARKMPEVVVTPERKATLRAVAAKREVAAVLAAEDQAKVIGTVALFRPGVPETEAWIPDAADLRHLAVDPSYHGKGVGVLLLDAIEEVARGWKVKAICLHVRRGAHGLVRMYEKRGYIRAPEGDIERPEIYLQGFICWLES
jgi:GNAT superfamily N-acetyltransferase